MYIILPDFLCWLFNLIKIKDQTVCNQTICDNRNIHVGDILQLELHQRSVVIWHVEKFHKYLILIWTSWTKDFLLILLALLTFCLTLTSFPTAATWWWPISTTTATSTPAAASTWWSAPTATSAPTSAPTSTPTSAPTSTSFASSWFDTSFSFTIYK